MKGFVSGYIGIEWYSWELKLSCQKFMFLIVSLGFFNGYLQNICKSI